MADSRVLIDEGATTRIDTRTHVGEDAGIQHRQVVTIGDPDLLAGVAPVTAAGGLLVEVSNNTALTDTELRASAVPVSAAALPLPSGAAEQTTLAAIDTKLGAPLTVNVGLTDAELRASDVPVDTGLDLSPLATETTLAAIDTKLAGTIDVDTGLTGLATETTLASIDTALAGTLSVNVGLTDAELRASDVPVDTGLDLSPLATEATLASIDAALAAPLTVNVGLTDAELRATPVPVSGTVSVSEILDVVDFIDTTPVLITETTNIPANASAHLEIVASLAANVKQIKVNDTTGEFIGVFTGAASSEILQCIIGPGQDNITPVIMNSGERVSVRNMANAAINVGSLCIQFIG